MLVLSLAALSLAVALILRIVTARPYGCCCGCPCRAWSDLVRLDAALVESQEPTGLVAYMQDAAEVFELGRRAERARLLGNDEHT